MSDELLLSLNGEAHRTAAATVAELLRELAVPPEAKGIALAVNDAVVPRRRWAETALAAGDRIELIRAMSGG